MDCWDKDFSIGSVLVKYTCEDYRKEMMLLALRERLQQGDLSEEERSKVIEEIKKLEEEIKIA
jgi:uncharacterized membrane protein